MYFGKTQFLSVLFREGKEWKEQRTVLNKYLLRSSAIAPYSLAINSVCEDLLDKIRTITLSTNQESAIIDLSSVLFSWSLEGWAFYFTASSLFREIEFLFPFLQIHPSFKALFFICSFYTFLSITSCRMCTFWKKIRLLGRTRCKH